MDFLVLADHPAGWSDHDVGADELAVSDRSVGADQEGGADAGGLRAEGLGDRRLCHRVE